jgi:hypothetical protein
MLTRTEADLVGTELKLGQAKTEAVDTEVLIDFGISVIQNVPKLWRIANENDRRRLQELVFPDGIEYDFKSGFETAKTGELYQLIEQIQNDRAKKSDVVGVDGLEPSTKGL